MQVKNLVYQVKSGDTIETSINIAIDMAKQAGQSVEFTHNGVKTIVDKYSTPNEIAKKINKANRGGYQIEISTSKDGSEEYKYVGPLAFEAQEAIDEDRKAIGSRTSVSRTSALRKRLEEPVSGEFTAKEHIKSAAVLEDRLTR